MSNLSYRTQKYVILVVFLAFPLLLLGTFTYYPAVKLVIQSFTVWDGISADKQWVGLANYRELFANDELFVIFTHNFAYFVAGIVQAVVALYFAVVLNGRLRGRYFFRLALFMPYIVNGVAVAYMFSYIYDTHTGALNYILARIGLVRGDPISWLGNVHLVNYSLAGVALWKYMGLNMVLYLGALQSISNEMYEAARIDGANGWQSFRHITLPNLTPVLNLLLFMSLAGSLEAFDLPFVLTKGGPMGASETFVTYTVNTAFSFSNFGLASAMGVVLFVIVTALVLIQRAVLTGRRSE